MLSNKSCRKKEEEGIFSVMTSVFPSQGYMWWSPAFQGMAEHLPVHEKLENNCFSFACAYSFCFTYWSVFISTHKLFHLYSSFISPIPVLGLSEGLCGLRLNHNILFTATVVLCNTTLQGMWQKSWCVHHLTHFAFVFKFYVWTK